MKLSVYIATSLDGFVARENGALDWLDGSSDSGEVVEKIEIIDLKEGGEVNGFTDFLDSVDLLIMGKNTFKKVLSIGMWCYGDTPVVVLSRNPVAIPQELQQWVKHSSQTPSELYEQYKQEGLQRIYVDGPGLIQSFLRDGLITDMTVTTIPVLIGSGIKLFGETVKDIKFLAQSTEIKDGFVESVYLLK